MAKPAGRFEWVSRVALIALICTVIVMALMLTGTVIDAVGVVRKMPNAATVVDLVPMVREAVTELAGVFAAFALYGLFGAVVATHLAARTTAGRLGRVESLLDDQAEDIRQLVDLASLSDRAKSLVYREREIEALCETVHHDIMTQDYATAERMIGSLEKDFGYMSAAARLREDLEASRRGTLDERIDAAIGRIQAIVEMKDWVRALRQAQRVISLFPGNLKALSLPDRIESAKAKHKRNLLEAYDAAVKRNEIDRGIELLKELDLYLTPQEGDALAESARGVFRAKLHNLGVQFAIKVTDQSWVEALAVGEQIMSEYPNSRMAHEVNEKIDLLRTRATAPAA